VTQILVLNTLNTKIKCLVLMFESFHTDLLLLLLVRQMESQNWLAASRSVKKKVC